VPGIPEKNQRFRKAKDRERRDSPYCFRDEQKPYLSEI
jgi:hypothetical protein